MSTNEEINGGEQPQELELEGADANQDIPGADPFDLIEDEGVRAEAKKFRAIANRKGKEKPPAPIAPKVEAPVINTSDFVTKKDLGVVAVNTAKGLVSDEVKDNWDALMGIPLAGYDSLDAQSIAKNMTERLAIFKARNPEDGKKKKEDVSDLTTTKATGTGSAPSVDKKTEVKNPPNFNMPTKPESWYKTPEN